MHEQPVMSQPALSSCEDRSLQPVVLRPVLRLLRDAILQGSRLRVAVATAQTAQLALLADQLESVAAEVRGMIGAPT